MRDRSKNDTPRRVTFGILLGSAVLLAGSGALARQATPQPNLADAAAVCAEAGGELVERSPVLSGNSPDPVRLADAAAFCEFSGGATADLGSRIVVLADTLAADQPSRAALAYRDRAPMPTPAPDAAEELSLANPASSYCEALGGTEGDWLAPNAAEAERIVTLCVFADRSAIDSWGLAYHAQDVIRGADLTDLFRYRSDQQADAGAGEEPVGIRIGTPVS